MPKVPLMLEPVLDPPRVVLERLCAERGHTFAALSRMLGKNPAYVQQYVRRGVPKELKEAERRKLASFLGVSEEVLGGPPSDPSKNNGLLTITRHSVDVSAGPGAVVSEELGRPYLGFDKKWLSALTPSPPDRLSIVRVEGDSMSPTLSSGDDILVDLADAGNRLRDGIYVLRVDDSVVVKRIALNPIGRRVTVQSDNPAYSDWPDLGINELNCIGRVIWAGRKVL